MLLVPLTGCGTEHLTGVDALPTPGCGAGEQRWREVYDAGLPATRDQVFVGELAEACPTSAELGVIARDLRLLFDEDPTRNEARHCVTENNPGLTRLQFSTYRTLIAMRNLRFTRPLPWTTANSLYDWFVTHVRGIRYRNLDHLQGDVGGYCCDPGNIVVIASGPETGVWASPFWSAFLLGRLVHEARHAEGISHSCGDRVDGSWTKDSRRQELGASGVEYYALWWIGEHGLDVPLLRRLSAYVGADAALRRGFCEGACPPLASTGLDTVSAAAAAVDELKAWGCRRREPTAPPLAR
jgi:hypothetical protein